MLSITEALEESSRRVVNGIEDYRQVKQGED